MSAHILLVEDEHSLRETLSLNLTMEGYQVKAVANGTDALSAVESRRVDLVILDVMLPDISGYDVCEALRVRGETMPILFLTARGATHERVQGLRLGANDYLSKPFALEELLLRVALLVKSPSPATMPNQAMQVGEAWIDFGKYSASKGEVTYELSKKEASLLRLLVESDGRTVTREDILEKVWGYDVYPSTRTIDNFIVAIRRLVEKDPRDPQHVKSVRGVGYLFTK